jgi:hypothetical protein
MSVNREWNAIVRTRTVCEKTSSDFEHETTSEREYGSLYLRISWWTLVIGSESVEWWLFCTADPLYIRLRTCMIGAPPTFVRGWWKLRESSPCLRRPRANRYRLIVSHRCSSQTTKSGILLRSCYPRIT